MKNKSQDLFALIIEAKENTNFDKLSEQITVLLKENSSIINEKNKNGYTSLWCAVVKKVDERLIKLLIDEGADVICKNKKWLDSVAFCMSA